MTLALVSPIFLCEHRVLGTLVCSALLELDTENSRKSKGHGSSRFLGGKMVVMQQKLAHGTVPEVVNRHHFVSTS